MTKKLKILMVSEASFVSSGFGTYTNEILKRLYATNKYSIAEFACYGKVNDPKDTSILWRYYANAVDGNDHRAKEYNSSMENQFGRWRFDRVLLDFQPDVVIDIRDYWMNSYQQFSPFRPFFHWVLMPTVDSAPQQEEWIDTFMQADAIFTYSDFGKNTLLEQSNKKIKYINTTSPGVDLDAFHPISDRHRLKQMFGLDENSFIIGSVMRNQKRKLIPELLVAFKQLIEKLSSDNNPAASKTYLYLHTSYPDAGWDIPKLLKEHQIGNRVLFTYMCRRCGHYSPSLFQHPMKHCSNCKTKSMSMPNVGNGLPTSNLNNIINLFDLYVQYAICEGFGMPQVEAGSAGVPIASVDYSAMNDVIKNLNGFPIRVNQFFRELETKAIRAYPDNDSLIKIIIDYMSLPDVLKDQKRYETRRLTEKYYNWDNISKKWEEYLDNVKLTGLQGNWSQSLAQLNNLVDLNNDYGGYDSIMGWTSTNIPNHPIASSLLLLNMIKDTDYGFISSGMQTQAYGLDKVKQTLENIINNHNTAMNAMKHIDKLAKEDYIEYANMKEKV